MSLQEKQNIAENVMNESVESELNEKAEEKLSKLMARLQRLEKETNQLDEKPQPLPEDKEMEDIDNIWFNVLIKNTLTWKITRKNKLLSFFISFNFINFKLL